MQIIGGYVEDMDFANMVGTERREPELFTFDVVCSAIDKAFPSDGKRLRRALVKMIGFDAAAGTNDRHFYNWGIITDPLGKRPPRFAPLFDNARGLFWNTDEQNLAQYRDPTRLKSYVDKAGPKIGCEGEAKPSHFRLVKQAADADTQNQRVLATIASREAYERIVEMMHAEFSRLLSPLRREVIASCLEVRFRAMTEILGGSW